MIDSQFSNAEEKLDVTEKARLKAHDAARYHFLRLPVLEMNNPIPKASCLANPVHNRRIALPAPAGKAYKKTSFISIISNINKIRSENRNGWPEAYRFL